MIPTMVEFLRACLMATLLVPLLAEPQGQTKGKDETPKPGKQVAAAPAPLSLVEMLAAALNHNPDIRVAEAKMREAEAELNRVRLQVTQRLSTYRAEHEKRLRIVSETQARLANLQKLHQAKSVSNEEVRTAEAALMLGKAELAVLEAELPYLLGQTQGPGAGTSVNSSGVNLDSPPRVFEKSLNFDILSNFVRARSGDGTVRLWDATTGKEMDVIERLAAVSSVNQGVADRVRAGMAEIVTVEFQGERLPEVLKALFQKGANMPNHIALDNELNSREVVLKLTDVPLSAVFLALEDQFPDQRDIGGADGLAFVVRDYGVLATTKALAPPGSVVLQSFLKGSGKPEKGQAPAKK